MHFLFSIFHEWTAHFIFLLVEQMKALNNRNSLSDIKLKYKYAQEHFFVGRDHFYFLVSNGVNRSTEA